MISQQRTSHKPAASGQKAIKNRRICSVSLCQKCWNRTYQRIVANPLPTGSIRQEICQKHVSSPCQGSIQPSHTVCAGSGSGHTVRLIRRSGVGRLNLETIQRMFQSDILHLIVSSWRSSR